MTPFSESFRATLSSRGCVLLPAQPGPIPGGVWLHGAGKRLALLAHTLTGRLAARDVRLVPSRAAEWRPPIEQAEFARWIHEVQDRLGQTICSWIVHLPADRRRRRFNLLLLDETRRPVGFAKLTANPPNPLAIKALGWFKDHPPAEFWAPGMLLEGSLGAFSYLVTSPMPNLAHRPARLDWESRYRIVSEFQTKLAHLVEAPSVLVHGDFGPWNVRRLSDGRITVIDWEEASAGVAVADELWHSISTQTQRLGAEAALPLVLQGLSHHAADDVVTAAEFWLSRLARPQPDEVDELVLMPARLDAASLRIEGVLKLLTASAN